LKDPVENNPALEAPLLELLRYLARKNYEFVTPTPTTHAIVLARGGSSDNELTDILGWNRLFARGSIDPLVENLLRAADMIETGAAGCRSLVRVSTLDGQRFLHSGYPTLDQDAVFFGPDSYRFADLIQRELGPMNLAEGALIVDIGTGSGVGAIVASGLQPSACVSMTDLNAKALQLAAINVKAAGMPIDGYLGAELAGLAGAVDVALANPPYIIDANNRVYRDGGGALGGDVSLRIARAAIDCLAPHGRLILYTGSAISNGRDAFHEEMIALAQSAKAYLRYRELDPDVFGEELCHPAYAKVDRIAVVAAVIEMP
jgi:methylase of polypeptide subunit release factors